MKLNMKSLLAATLAGSLALGTAATPALADRGETMRTIVGIAALAIIANEIAKNNKKKDQDRAYGHTPPPPVWNQGQDWRHDRWDDRHGRRKQVRDSLPAVCSFDVRGQRGPSTVVSKSCLRDQGIRIKLPERCEFPIRTRYGAEQVYGASCLQSEGYRIGGRRY